MVRRRRIWSEEVPFAIVRSRRVLALLAERGMDLCLAVRPGAEEGLSATVGACMDAGIAVALWPMLADRDGRWASEGNQAAFAAFSLRVVRGLERDGLAPAEVVIDLEPAIERVRAAFALRFGAFTRPSRQAAPKGGEVATFEALSAELCGRGIARSCAVLPLVALGPNGVWEAALGTPVSGTEWDHVSAMLYSSLIEGWSGGLLRRADAVAVVEQVSRQAVARFGARVGASLGAVGVGAFGSEPVLRSPKELREDVRAARAAGIDALTLLDLGGVLARPPAEGWLDAFVEPMQDASGEPCAAPTRRATLALGAVAAAGRAVDLAVRLRRGP